MCNPVSSVTVAEALPEFTSERGAARAMLNEVRCELENALANGQKVTLHMTERPGHQWQIVMEEVCCDAPVQLAFPLELGICQQSF